MHRGHLDPEVATMPAKAGNSARVIANAKEVLDLAREHGIPEIHVILVYRGSRGWGAKA